MILTNYPLDNYELKQLISPDGEIYGIILYVADDTEKSIQLKNKMCYSKL